MRINVELNKTLLKTKTIKNPKRTWRIIVKIKRKRNKKKIKDNRKNNFYRSIIFNIKMQYKNN